MGCLKSKYSVLTQLNDLMNEFYFRLIHHDFIMSKITEFNNSNKTYHEFWNLTKLLGVHPDLKFQVKFWESAFVQFYDLNLDGLLFLFILLSDAKTTEKKYLVRFYLSSRYNNSITNENDLIMNLSEFKNILYVYISCLTTIPLKIIHEMRFDPEYEKYKEIFSDNNIKNFTDGFIKSFVRKNYYVNAGAFFDAKFDLLINDKLIRETIFKEYMKENINHLNKKIIQSKDLNSLRYLKTVKKGFTRREDSKDDDDELKIKYDDEQYKLDENNQISNKLDVEEDINSQESRKDYQSNSSEYRPFKTSVNNFKDEFKKNELKALFTQ
jgi:hypothetical protein